MEYKLNCANCGKEIDCNKEEYICLAITKEQLIGDSIKVNKAFGIANYHKKCSLFTI